MGQRPPLLVGLAARPHITPKAAQLLQRQRLRAIHESLARHRVEVHQHHVGPGDQALRHGMQDVGNAVGRHIARADGVRDPMQTGMRVRRCTTGTCAKSTRLRCGSPKFVFMPRRQNTIWLPSDAIFGRAERLVQRDAEPALDQHREFLLAADRLQQFEVLGVPRADLNHHACQGCPACFNASAISSTWLSCSTSIATTLMPYLPASSKT